MSDGSEPDAESRSAEGAEPTAPPTDQTPATAPDWPSDTAQPARATVYWVLALLLPMGALLLRGGQRYSTAPVLHLVSESVAASLALVLGALALVRFHTSRQRTYLFIGTGFAAAGVLDVFHAWLSADFYLGGALLPVTEVDASAWSWLQSRVFLSLFLFVSLLAWQKGDRVGASRVSEKSVYLTAIGLTSLIVAFFVVVQLQLSRAVHPGWIYPRPQELLPAVLFGAAFVGYFRRGLWRVDAFQHWLMISLLIGAMTHAAYMGFSRVEGDALYTAAHLLKISSYLALLAGVVASVYLSARREHAALAAIRGMNQTLEREIGVRSEAEQVLQRSEERLKGFLDGAHDLIQSTAPDGRILYVNPAWESALGYQSSQLRGLRLTDLLHEQCRDRVLRQFDALVAGNAIGRIEVDFLTAEGGRVTCSGSATRFVSGSQEISIQAIFRDVTRQRGTERELASSRANLAAVVESTGEGIWSVDEQQRLVTLNSAFSLAVEAQTGREPRRGDLPEQIFPADDVEWYRGAHQRALAGERFSELRDEEVGGEPRVFEVFGHPVYGDEGVTGAVMFGRDVTRRILAEDALRMARDEAEAANRAKSQFLASMSHELRTPLNSVIGFGNILLKNKRGHLDDQELGFLQRVLSNGKHLLSLINEVLDLAKIEAGRMDVDLDEVDLSELVRETAQALEGQAREKRVDLSWDVPDSEVVARTDRAKLKQVIINLVGNALKFSEGGQVEVVLEMTDGAPSAIAVRDSGIGIPEDRLEAIFEAFQQADGTTARRFGGTGLGLAISRSICLLLGYDMTVTSRVGEGSTFTIVLATEEARNMRGGGPAEATEGADTTDGTDARDATEEDELPAAGFEAAVIAVGAAAARRGTGLSPGSAPGSVAGSAPVSAVESQRRELRILVIDDDADSRFLMEHILTDYGCSVATASSAREGLASARAHPPDLITLDLMMPEVSGWEALQLFKEDEALRDIPVVVVSVVAAEDRSRLLGAVDLVTKPVDREDLLRVLWRNLVRNRGGRVMMVEDDPGTRLLFRTYLEAAGLDVTEAENGREALRIIDRDAPDAVLLDLVMPEMDGIAFLEKLRKNPYYVGLPVVVLTSKALTPDEEEFLRQHASSVIQKGEDVEGQLRAVLGTILPLDGD